MVTPVRRLGISHTIEGAKRALDHGQRRNMASDWIETTTPVANSGDRRDAAPIKTFACILILCDD